MVKFGAECALTTEELIGLTNKPAINSACAHVGEGRGPKNSGHMPIKKETKVKQDIKIKALRDNWLVLVIAFVGLLVLQFLQDVWTSFAYANAVLYVLRVVLLGFAAYSLVSDNMYYTVLEEMHRDSAIVTLVEGLYKQALVTLAKGINNHLYKSKGYPITQIKFYSQTLLAVVALMGWKDSHAIFRSMNRQCEHDMDLRITIEDITPGSSVTYAISYKTFFKRVVATYKS